jgi:hypothetical protein
MTDKIEDLNPHYRTVLQALRYGLEVIDNPDMSDKEKLARAKHQIRDAMHILGYTDHLVETYRKP